VIDVTQIAKDLREGRLAIDSPDPVRVPYVYREFPKWKHHAREASVLIYSDVEEQALGTEWADSPAEAVAVKARLDELVANAAAERAYDDRRLGEKAQAELTAFEQSTGAHVLDVPVKPER
jgi:hypothetical protein